MRQHATAQGELVDRLMAKIAELETKLYDRDLASNQQQLIPAVTCKQAAPVPTFHKNQILNSGYSSELRLSS